MSQQNYQQAFFDWLQDFCPNSSGLSSLYRCHSHEAIWLECKHCGNRNRPLTKLFLPSASQKSPGINETPILPCGLRSTVKTEFTDSVMEGNPDYVICCNHIMSSFCARVLRKLLIHNIYLAVWRIKIYSRPRLLNGGSCIMLEFCGNRVKKVAYGCIQQN